MEFFTNLTYMLYFVIALQIIDGLTTIYALSKTGAKEGNGFLKPIMDKIGVIPTMVGLKSILIVCLFIWGYTLSLNQLYLIAVIYTGIAINNLYVIYRLRNR